MFLSKNKLAKIGFAHLGRAVLISERAVFYRPEKIEIGDRTRIDDFCVLSAGDGGIYLGKNIHLAVGATLRGKEKIILEDFSTLSGGVDIYSGSDDYSGETLTNPTVPDEFKKVHYAPVHLGKHVIVGAKSVILPGVTLGEGCAIGAFSLVKKDCQAWSLYAGQPARFIKKRSKKLLRLEKEYLLSIPPTPKR